VIAQYALVALVVTVAFLLVTVVKLDRRIRSARSELDVHRAQLALHNDQFSIARDLLVCHHIKLEFDDLDPYDFIWPDDDEDGFPPMEFK